MTGRLLLAIAALTNTACQMPDLELSERSCPCGNGWFCDRDRNVCVTTETRHDADISLNGGDADADADADSDSDGSDGDVPNLLCDWREDFFIDSIEKVTDTYESVEYRHPSLSLDGLTLYYVESVPGVYQELTVTTRPRVGSPFETSQQLQMETGDLSLSWYEKFSVMDDGHTAYFSAWGEGGSADILTGFLGDYFMVQVGGRVEALSGDLDDHGPTLTSDGLTIYFSRDRQRDSVPGDIFIATRDTQSVAFGSPQPMDSINSNSAEMSPTVTGGGEVLVFSSDRGGSSGGFDLWYSLREGNTYREPELIPGSDFLNTGGDEFEPAINADGCELYFVASRDDATSFDIYRAEFSR